MAEDALLRFDDALDTVLAADRSTPIGAQSAWRQLVDLIGRGRVAASPEAIGELARLRARVPLPVRAASARALVGAEPPAALVRFMAEDELSVAAPVLRSAVLPGAEWIAMLAALSPGTRSVLRHRRDLAPEVARALESFGSVDFVLPEPDRSEVVEVESPAAEPAPVVPPAAQDTSPFVRIAEVAAGLPLVAEAMRVSREASPIAEPASDPRPTGTFRISELVARIDAYKKERGDRPARAVPPPSTGSGFRFETDAQGIVRWVDGIPRASLVGLSLDLAGLPSGTRVDGVAAGAFRQRASFSAARLIVAGVGPAAGAWRLSAVPIFDRASGRFTGYRGTGRRPRADEQAETVAAGQSDGLRQLVHELRTPTNAIAGFAEMIEEQLLGPVAGAYRERATEIRQHAHDLLAAIEDIDMAARLDSRALDLRPGDVPLAPLLDRIGRDLEPLLTLRRATMEVEGAPELVLRGDDRALARLLARLGALVAAAATPGERLAITIAPDGEFATIGFQRPHAFAGRAPEALLTMDAERAAAAPGQPLLGVGFSLRLARNLAAELGGSLTIGSERLTLRLPAAVTASMEQAVL